ncbi:MAG: HAD family hydrolase [Clostridia bacterium]|nr:HAD family hydrolase [Clostridia bacterium]
MKKYEAVLFDLDGTLLPMDYDGFIKGYLGLLCQKVGYLGYGAKELVGAMWQGVGAMVKNDGTMTNCDAFWKAFAGVFGDKVYEDIPVFDKFYTEEFHGAKAFTGENPLALKAVELARKAADKVVLATNPIFPSQATSSRLSWIGLSYGDFDFVTDYYNSGYCKPSPKYYVDIAQKMGVDATKCLMVGNNTEEDIVAAAAAGMDTYLITDCLLCEKEMPECKKGTFAEFIEFMS